MEQNDVVQKKVDDMNAGWEATKQFSQQKWQKAYQESKAKQTFGSSCVEWGCLHIPLGILTCGLWFIIWAIANNTAKKKDREITEKYGKK